jgi:hypothetical protein
VWPWLSDKISDALAEVQPGATLFPLIISAFVRKTNLPAYRCSVAVLFVRKNLLIAPKQGVKGLNCQLVEKVQLI